jgi:hypothetical protein
LTAERRVDVSAAIGVGGVEREDYPLSIFHPVGNWAAFDLGRQPNLPGRELAIHQARPRATRVSSPIIKRTRKRAVAIRSDVLNAFPVSMVTPPRATIDAKSIIQPSKAVLLYES